MTENLVLPVREVMSAVCLVPAHAAGSGSERKGQVRPAVSCPGSRRTCRAEDARRGRGDGGGSAVVCLLPLSVAWQKHLGVPQELL